jgi:hypothetical protein
MKRSHAIYGCLLLLALALQPRAVSQQSAAFKGYPSRSGGEPAGGVIRDSAGNLYGVTSIGGDLNCQPVNGCGVVFKLTP